MFYWLQESDDSWELQRQISESNLTILFRAKILFPSYKLSVSCVNRPQFHSWEFYMLNMQLLCILCIFFMFLIIDYILFISFSEQSRWRSLRSMPVRSLTAVATPRLRSTSTQRMVGEAMVLCIHMIIVLGSHPCTLVLHGQLSKLHTLKSPNSFIFIGNVIKKGILHTLRFCLHTLSCHFWLFIYDTHSYQKTTCLLHNHVCMAVCIS